MHGFLFPTAYADDAKPGVVRMIGRVLLATVFAVIAAGLFWVGAKLSPIMDGAGPFFLIAGMIVMVPFGFGLIFSVMSIVTLKGKLGEMFQGM